MRKKYPEPYKNPQSRYYYHKYYDEHGVRRSRSTGIPYKGQDRGTIDEARAEVRRYIDKLEEHKNLITFGEYAEPFFDWSRCPRIRRFLQEDKTIGKEYSANVRSVLEKYVLHDKFADITLKEVRRGDILDLRDRLKESTDENGDILKLSTINLVMKGVKAIFSEAVYREMIIGSPADRIGELKAEYGETGVFYPLEIVQLMDAAKGWPFTGLFKLLALTGMRSGEVYAIRWRQWDGEKRILTINRAFKSHKETGLPKWEKVRTIPLCELASGIFKQAQIESIRLAPDDLVFSWDDGNRIGHTYFTKRFHKLLESTVIYGTGGTYTIDRVERNIKPKSLRHSFATLLTEMTVNPVLIRQYMGWSNEGLLSRVQDGYTHITINALSEIPKLVDKHMEDFSKIASGIRTMAESVQDEGI